MHTSSMLTRRIVAWDAHMTMRQLQRSASSVAAFSQPAGRHARQQGISTALAPQQGAATVPFMRGGSGRRMHLASPLRAGGEGLSSLPPEAARLLAQAAAQLLEEEGSGSSGKAKQGKRAPRDVPAAGGQASAASGSGASKDAKRSAVATSKGRSSDGSSGSSNGSVRSSNGSNGKLDGGKGGGRAASAPSTSSAPAASRSKSVSKGSAPKAGDTDGTDAQRLAKVLAGAGVASRRACEALIEAGKVKVNGVVVQQQGTTVQPDKDVVTVDGKRIVLQQSQHVYFMVNKPKGYICSNVDTADGKGKRVVDILKPWIDDWSSRQQDKKVLPPRLFTVGRLDVASHGLILVTNDGHWAQKVIHPSAEITKEYIVRVDKAVPQSGLETILKGTEVEGSFVAPVEVSTLETKERLRIVVKEGKKHEVRQLVAAAGFEVQSLKRVRIGGLRIPTTLGLGSYKQMSGREVKSVTDVGQQESLRRNAWASAKKLLVR